VFPAGLPADSRGADFVAANLAKDSVRTAGRVFGYLSASKQEVTGVLEQFKSRQGFFARWFDNKAHAYLEHEAKEANLKSTALRDYRYVHFATHGLFNEKSPKLSGLVMAQDTTSNEDGILYLGEIYNLDLNADLVTLSACETGLGQIAKGEGIIGLTRGFLYAGAANLLVSLWQVNDQTTADLMVDFYGNMLNGQTKAVALRQAKLNLIRSHPEYAKPYYWAPFVLVGR
jgi:CHAT domain-containing protein